MHFRRYPEAEEAIAYYFSRVKDHGPTYNFSEPSYMKIAYAFQENLNEQELPRWRETFLAHAFEDREVDCAVGLVYSRDKIACEHLLNGVIDGSLSLEVAVRVINAFAYIGYEKAAGPAMQLRSKVRTGPLLIPLQSAIEMFEKKARYRSQENDKH